MTQMFVSLPTSDIERSKAFYTALGCEINPNFTDENSACVVWGENAFFMMMQRDFFATFTEKTIIDPRTHAQTSISFSKDSREDVDAILDKGLAAGGREPQPPQDLGFMYSRDIEDPDGNVIGFLYMDPVAAEQGPPEAAAQ